MSSRLPDPLFAAIEARLLHVPVRTLRAGYEALSTDYRNRTVSEAQREDLLGLSEPVPGRAPGGYTRAQARGLAYLAARFPATYAAAQAALRQVPDAALDGCQSVLDLGAGPGTATWALMERLPTLQQATFLESEPEMLGHAQALAGAFEPLKVTVTPGDLRQRLAEAPQHDIVVMAYVLSELDEASQLSLLDQAWAKADRGLFLLEPGTPETSRRVLVARDQLLKAGGRLVGPCPQEGACPMAEKDKFQWKMAKDKPEGSYWCHFSIRLERRGLHHMVKSGVLGYEDEKFSWLYVTKGTNPGPAYPYRLHSDPKRVNRHIELKVCDHDGKLDTLFYNRRDTAQNIRNAARRLNWGFGWDPKTVPELPPDEDFDDGETVS
jgi:ribosomal protein RSM22 (predicted rRNA methylase)